MSVRSSSSYSPLTLERLKHEFTAIERLSVTAGCIALHAAEPHEREKSALLKPLLGMLRLESVHDVADFRLANISIERHKHTGSPEVTVILWNLVLQDDVIPESVPSQF
jgi:hypothetical protein